MRYYSKREKKETVFVLNVYIVKMSILTQYDIHSKCDFGCKYARPIQWHNGDAMVVRVGKSAEIKKHCENFDTFYDVTVRTQ